MSTERKITVTLTEQQFRALSAAVATAGAEWWEHAGEGDRSAGHWSRTLDRAWDKIVAAWYDRERPRRTAA